LRRFHGSDEGAHEFFIGFAGESVNIEALAGEEFTGVFDAVDARGLDGDLFEAGGLQLRAVIILFERARNAADP
jgi:hypothetical protein